MQLNAKIISREALRLFHQFRDAGVGINVTEDEKAQWGEWVERHVDVDYEPACLNFSMEEFSEKLIVEPMRKMAQSFKPDAEFRSDLIPEPQGSGIISDSVSYRGVALRVALGREIIPNDRHFMRFDIWLVDPFKKKEAA